MSHDENYLLVVPAGAIFGSADGDAKLEGLLFAGGIACAGAGDGVTTTDCCA